MKQNTALTANKKTGDVYRWDGDLRFTNLTTGRGGELETKEQAQQAFVIPVQLNAMASQNENLIMLIQVLGLSLDNLPKNIQKR